jgi:hypothetical protein
LRGDAPELRGPKLEGAIQREINALARPWQVQRSEGGEVVDRYEVTVLGSYVREANLHRPDGTRLITETEARTHLGVMARALAATTWEGGNVRPESDVIRLVDALIDKQISPEDLRKNPGLGGEGFHAETVRRRSVFRDFVPPEAVRRIDE